MNNEIIIIGGGISGLRLASLLAKAGISFKILESRDYVGGRVLTKIEDKNNYFDLGPTWFWPEKEPIITKLIKDLHIPTVEQYNQGDSLLELDKDGNVKRFDSSTVNSRSIRIIGGVKELIDNIKKNIPKEAIHTNTKVKKITKNENSYAIESVDERNNKINTYKSNKVVLCLPPRLLIENIRFSPRLNEETYLDLLNKPTWMGAQAKIVLTFEYPFWRDNNLSGNVISWVGPLREVYDASTEKGQAALFGFFSLSPENRIQFTDDEIKTKVINQLIPLFGNEIKNYQSIYYKDWSLDTNMTTAGDKLNIESFPKYGPTINPPANLYFAGTEYDELNGGHLEGALRSANRVANEIITKLNIKKY